MSWYDSEHDWPQYPVQHRPPVVPRTTIRCVRCSASAETPAFGEAMVGGQIRLWLLGWRRDPSTATDHCPDCARAL